MMKVNRVAHASFLSTDIEAQIDHYTNIMGLSLVDRNDEGAFLTTGVDHHTVVLRKGDVSKCDAIGFQLAPNLSLDEFAKHVESKGVSLERLSDSQPNISDLLKFRDPNGTAVEVFVDHETVGTGMSNLGVVPNKLGHIAFSCEDVQTVVKFYNEVLGFTVSDWMGDFFAFMRCGPDHHTMNFVGGAKSKMHHIAFELRDFTHIRDACDLLARDGITLEWGPVRHGIGHNISTYHRNADGQIIELFCELDRVDEAYGTLEPRRMHQSYPQKQMVWEDMGLASNMWGPPPPEGFLD